MLDQTRTTKSKKKSEIEKEAQFFIGEMREATIAEQKFIQANIDKIAFPTGINFWDCN